jgi:autophagy-related protein 9
VEHLFHERLNMSYFFATRYLEQFPKVKTSHFAAFVMFVTGSIIAVLSISALLDPEMFFSFEIVGETSVALWITGLSAIWAVMSGSVPEPNGVFNPEHDMRSVIQYTHYLPPHWEDRLETNDVMREFSSLYQMKLMQFFQEILCIVALPFVLGVSLPRCSDRIIDFFREFTVHVDGVGYVCSFAVFDFKRGDGRNGGQAQIADARDDYYSTKHGKMAASYYGFIDNYVNQPKNGGHRHAIPGMRHDFNHPPTFPGLQSPSLAADLQSSRMGRSERRTGRGLSALAQAARTPRFAAAQTHGSPMTSMLLDPIHQSGYGVRSTHPGTMARHQLRNNITEEASEEEDEEDGRRGRFAKQTSSVRDPYESVAGLGESRWETSPTRDTNLEDDIEADQVGVGGGVLGLLYQYQKAQSDRPGVNI